MASHEKPETNKMYISIIEAKNLKAADANGKSDPYVVIKNTKGLHAPKDHHVVKTKVIDKNLNPVWNETFTFEWSYSLSKIVLTVFDHDKFTADDKIGKVTIQVSKLFGAPEIDQWYNIQPQGQIHVKFRLDTSFPLLVPGAFLPINSLKFTIGLGWDFSKKTGSVDLDSSVVAFGRDGRVIDAAWYRQLQALGGVLQHKGDNRTGEGKGDDEEIMVNLEKLTNQEVVSLGVIVTSFSGQTFDKLKSAYIRLKDPQTHRTLVLARLNDMQASTALFFGYLYWVAGQWYFKTVAVPVHGRSYTDTIPEVLPHLKY